MRKNFRASPPAARKTGGTFSACGVLWHNASRRLAGSLSGESPYQAPGSVRHTDTALGRSPASAWRHLVS
jgi:hypothetical protein